ncbi:hypothetical protein ABPG72_005130 [Tetrahymena utriculariae]
MLRYLEILQQKVELYLQRCNRTYRIQYDYSESVVEFRRWKFYLNCRLANKLSFTLFQHWFKSQINGILLQKEQAIHYLLLGKLLERHIQYFNMIKQYQIPNIFSIEDIEDSENEILILSRDQRAFRFDINTEELTKKYPLSLEGQKYAILNGFVKLITLKDYQIFASGGKRAIEIYATSSSQDIPIIQLFQREYIQKNSLFDQSDIVGIDDTNLIAIQSYLQQMLILEIYLDKQINKIKAMEKFKKSIFNFFLTRIFYMDKQMNHNLIVFYQQSSTEQIQFEAFVYQIIIEQNKDQSTKILLKVLGIWTIYKLLKENFSVLNYLPQSMRVYGIINDQQLSYELLDGEGFECDYDGIFIIFYNTTNNNFNFYIDSKIDLKLSVFYHYLILHSNQFFVCLIYKHKNLC